MRHTPMTQITFHPGPAAYWTSRRCAGTSRRSLGPRAAYWDLAAAYWDAAIKRVTYRYPTIKVKKLVSPTADGRTDHARSSCRGPADTRTILPVYDNK
jgi:hypothetical protein